VITAAERTRVNDATSIGMSFAQPNRFASV
jgi:hypothetical protein